MDTVICVMFLSSVSVQFGFIARLLRYCKQSRRGMRWNCAKFSSFFFSSAPQFSQGPVLCGGHFKSRFSTTVVWPCVPCHWTSEKKCSRSVSPIAFLFAHLRKRSNLIFENIPLWCHKEVLMLLADFWQLLFSQSKSSLHSEPPCPPPPHYPWPHPINCPPSPSLSCARRWCTYTGVQAPQGCKLVNPLCANIPDDLLRLAWGAALLTFRPFAHYFSRNVRQLQENNRPTVLSCLVLLWFLTNRCHRVCLGVAINTDDRGGLLNCEQQTLET